MNGQIEKRDTANHSREKFFYEKMGGRVSHLSGVFYLLFNACRFSVPELLIRLMVGFVFLSEGIQKFLFAEKLGVGRFAKIGLPYPELLGPFVGGTEILCGLLVLTGLLTRWACLPLLAIIIVALLVTKLPLLALQGFWLMAHESRTDFCMLLGLCFIVLAGPGSLSLDRCLSYREKEKTEKS